MPPFTIGVVFTEAPIYYTYTSQKYKKSLKRGFPQIKRFENGFENFFLILPETPLFLPDFSDWWES